MDMFLIVPHCNTAKHENYVVQTVVKLWKNLPANITTISDPVLFRTQLCADELCAVKPKSSVDLPSVYLSLLNFTAPIVFFMHPFLSLHPLTSLVYFLLRPGNIFFYENSFIYLYRYSFPNFVRFGQMSSLINVHLSFVLPDYCPS